MYNDVLMEDIGWIDMKRTQPGELGISVHSEPQQYRVDQMNIDGPSSRYVEIMLMCKLYVTLICQQIHARNRNPPRAIHILLRSRRPRETRATTQETPYTLHLCRCHRQFTSVYPYPPPDGRFAIDSGSLRPVV